MKNIFNRVNKYYLLLFLALIIFAFLILYIWKFTADDAYISFRYALHLVQGYGLIWNINEPPIEGYTNFLWVLLSSIVIFLKLDPVIFTKILGISSVIWIVFVYWVIAKDMFEDKKLIMQVFCISSILLLVNPATTIHAVSGLETMFYSLLILINMFLAYKLILSANNRLFWLFACVSLISSIVRPEGILISTGLFILIYITALNKNDDIKNKINQCLPFILGFIIPIGVYMLFRILYFHELFPLPFLVKSVSMGGLFSGIDALGSAIKYIAPFAIIIILYLLKNVELVSKKILNSKIGVLIITMCVTIFFADVLYIFSFLLMNYVQRFYYPSFVIIYIVTAIFLVLLINELKNTKLNELYNKKTSILGFLIVLLLLSSNLSFVLEVQGLHHSADRFSSSYIPLAHELSFVSYDNLTFASVDAGSLPYFSGWNHIDILGLNNKFIAKNGVGTEEYIEKNRPDLILFISTDNKTINSKEQVPFLEFAKKNGYIQLPSIKYLDNYYLVPFLDPKTKDFNKIKNSLEKVSKSSFN
ncbi:MAG: hypothetical protein HZC47_08135 [Methanobacterium sp.]|uniref:hypothetical protein n=1 Tax=Methanobacterium sp. TaxID=2164 RepID=UPI003D657159|nr:hypothetical protein [Methanobacterium sp.]